MRLPPWLRHRFHAQKATTAWATIKMTLAKRAPDAPEPTEQAGRIAGRPRNNACRTTCADI